MCVRLFASVAFGSAFGLQAGIVLGINIGKTQRSACGHFNYVILVEICCACKTIRHAIVIRSTVMMRFRDVPVRRSR